MLSTPTRAPGPSTAPTSTSKKNLQHLVGRALVPFFLPGEDVKENTTHSIPTTSDDFTQGVSSVPVRTFVDGYFVDSGTLTDSNTAPSTEKRKKVSSSIQTPVKHKSKQNNTMPTPIPTPAPASTSTSTSSTRYAAPAFCNSPSPMKVPLPKFITQPTSTSSLPVLPEQERAPVPDVMSLLRPKSLNNVPIEEPEHHYTLHKKSPSVPVTPSTSTSTSTTSSTDAGQALIQLLRAGTYAHPTAPITSTTSATTITTDTTSTVTTPRLLLLRQDSTGTLGVHSIPVSTVEPDYSNKQYRLPTTTTTTTTTSPTTSYPTTSPSTTSYPFFPSTTKPVASDDSDASAAHLSQTLKSLLSIR